MSVKVVGRKDCAKESRRRRFAYKGRPEDNFRTLPVGQILGPKRQNASPDSSTKRSTLFASRLRVRVPPGPPTIFISMKYGRSLARIAAATRAVGEVFRISIALPNLIFGIASDKTSLSRTDAAGGTVEKVWAGRMKQASWKSIFAYFGERQAAASATRSEVGAAATGCGPELSDASAKGCGLAADRNFPDRALTNDPKQVSQWCLCELGRAVHSIPPAKTASLEVEGDPLQT